MKNERGSASAAGPTTLATRTVTDTDVFRLSRCAAAARGVVHAAGARLQLGWRRSRHVPHGHHL